MQKWEYMVIQGTELKTNKLEEVLRQAGASGWEWATIYTKEEPLRQAGASGWEWATFYTKEEPLNRVSMEMFTTVCVIFKRPIESP